MVFPFSCPTFKYTVILVVGTDAFMRTALCEPHPKRRMRGVNLEDNRYPRVSEHKAITAIKPVYINQKK